MKRFALIGVGGFIAPRHLKAIKDTGNILVAALDKNDSVGIIDSYFPDADFFTEFERFDRHLEKLRRANEKHCVDYVSICSPNYLHDAHVRFALRIGASAICEKPLVLNPWNVEALGEIEKESKGNINTILQLRLHPAIIELKKKIDSAGEKVHDIDLTYITSRGHWYMASWKGSIEKSGGVATNIGIHFFDMLAWVFGDVKKNTVHLSQPKRAAGFLELQKANVRWFLSLERSDLPFEAKPGEPATYRSVTIDDKEVEFSGGFGDLHTVSYQKILEGNGFGLNEVLTSVQIVSDIRRAEAVGIKGEYHPMLKKIKDKR
ncbi:MAG: Gfo/Idh/MocA family oxidoreductase [Sedimentisphaerales bacterium]|nr:Gfo/Idh/MocA family oxidoreductase [Sedimentisphaerales bacterium]